VLELPQDEQDDQHQAEPEIVLARFRRQRHPEQVRLGNAAEAAHAPGERHPELGDQANHLHEGDRHHREVHPAQAERRIADHDAHQGGQDRPTQERELERNREILRQQRRGVGADRHERRVTDVELATCQGRPEAGGENHVGEDEREDVHVVVAAEVGHEQCQHDQDRQHAERAGPRTHTRRGRSAGRAARG
jgi:hypothetical protein